jgi:MOSC domain-containing protein YiiM
MPGLAVSAAARRVGNVDVSIEHLFVSPGHNFFGHHGRPAGAHPAVAVKQLRCLAGRGIEGDRFLDYKPDYAGQITFFEAEVFAGLCAALRLSEATPAGLRRNVVTRGLRLEELAGREFCVQGVWFRGAGECKPCYWMDAALASGAESWLKGRGGLRARILTDGVLRVGSFTSPAAAIAPASRLGSLSGTPLPSGYSG